MKDWLPIIVGFVIVAAAIAAARLAPNSTVGTELRRWYGIVPSGNRGHRTRRDLLKSAALSFAVAVGLAVTCVGAAVLEGRYPNESRGNLIAQVYTFAAFLLTAVSLLVALGALWKSVFWHIELPDLPEHRRAFADAMDRVLDGVTSPAQESEYLGGVRYRHREMEEIRRSTLRMVGEHGSSLPDNFREQFKALAASIRGSAG